MADTNNGGPAFPKLTSGHVEESRGSGHDNMRFVSTDGMSLRDYFAAKAMPEAINHHLAVRATTISPGQFDFDLVAVTAYKVADAMLKARG